MKHQILFSRKNKGHIIKLSSANVGHSVLSVNYGFFMNMKLWILYDHLFTICRSL